MLCLRRKVSQGANKKEKSIFFLFFSAHGGGGCDLTLTLFNSEKMIPN